MKEKIKNLINNKNTDFILFLIVVFAVIYIHNFIASNILLGVILVHLLQKIDKKEKYKLLFLLTSTITLSLFIGVHYKLLFLITFCLSIGYYLKKGKLILLSIALLISPSIYISNVYVSFEKCLDNINKSFNTNDILTYNHVKSFYNHTIYSFPESDKNKSSNEYNNINGQYQKEYSNNISYYYNLCQLYSAYCDPIKDNPIEKSTVSNLSIYFSNITRYDNYGNEYQIVRNKGIDSKRYIYSFNKASKNIKETTIFIPFTKEEVVIYNYFWLKDFVWEEVLQNKNKCKLLFYGTQNGWDKYKNQLINELSNDKDNSCIRNIEDYDIEIDETKLDKDKKNFSNVLKDKGEL